MPWYLGNSNFTQSSMVGWMGVCIIPLLLWSFVWKGMALWYAGRRSEKVWFIILLAVNTIGVLEIIYLLFIAKVFSKKSESKKHPPKKKKRK